MLNVINILHNCTTFGLIKSRNYKLHYFRPSGPFFFFSVAVPSTNFECACLLSAVVNNGDYQMIDSSTAFPSV